MQSLPHFASVTMAPMFEVYEVYGNPDHWANSLLRADLEKITEVDVAWFEKHDELKHHIKNENTLERKKLIIFIEMVSEEISRMRIEKLVAHEDTP